MRLAVRPNLPGQISLGVGDRLPLLHEDGVARHGLDGLAQQPFSLAGWKRPRQRYIGSLHGDDDAAAIGDHLKRMPEAGESGGFAP